MSQTQIWDNLVANTEIV